MTEHSPSSLKQKSSLPESNPPLPVLLIGHGSRDPHGRQAVLDLAKAFAQFDPQRPVIPCFLELTEPTIADGVARCDRLGVTEAIALPVLLFGARHNKFDITNELDRLQALYPHITFHYGAPIGISTDILNLLRQRLEDLQRRLQANDTDGDPEGITKEDTVLLFVGRGSSDPEANSEACKLARLLWEGSGYGSVEVCFIGITHPRLEVGFERALLLKPKRIIVVPYFLFTGVLVKKIQASAEARQASLHDVDVQCLPELGIVEAVLGGLYQREREAQAGQVKMNCQLCKFRLAASTGLGDRSHQHRSHHHHHHEHSLDREHDRHGESHQHGLPIDPYAAPMDYHKRVWQVP